jgi:hypothetical protein
MAVSILFQISQLQTPAENKAGFKRNVLPRETKNF